MLGEFAFSHNMFSVKMLGVRSFFRKLWHFENGTAKHILGILGIFRHFVLQVPDLKKWVIKIIYLCIMGHFFSDDYIYIYYKLYTL